MTTVTTPRAATISVPQAEPGVAPSPDRGRIAQIAVIAALLLAGHLPLLVKFFQDLWSRPQYQFFPVALIAAGYIAWERLRETKADRAGRGSEWIGLGLLAFSWIVLSTGLLYLRWMAPVAAWLTLAAAVWWAGGARLFRVLLPAGVLLLVIIPPPAQYDLPIGNHLRLLAVHASSRLLDFLSVPHLVTGTVIEIPGHRLLVEEACSGINSLMSVIAFSLLFGFWQRRPGWRVALLALVGGGFVLCANVVRITIGAVLIQNWRIDILSGSAHEMLGALLFAASVGLVMSFDQFLQLIDRRQTSSPATTQPDAIIAPPNTYGRPRRLLPWWIGAVAFAVLGVAMQARVGHAWARSRLADEAAFTLPEHLAGWERVKGDGGLIGRPETDGRKSHFWLFRSGTLSAAVAMDYPFNGFHDATICYATAGWTVMNRTAFAGAGSPSASLFYEAQLSKPPMVRAQLLFGLFDEQGRPPEAAPPIPPGSGRIAMNLFLSRGKALALPMYQVQTLTLGYAPLSADEEARLRALFKAARAELSPQLISQVGNGS
jgi:exosortase